MTPCEIVRSHPWYGNADWPDRIPPTSRKSPVQADLAHPEPTWLTQSRQHAQTEQLPYAGLLTPRQAWHLVHAGEAVLLDVRTAEERTFVGRVPGSLHVPWATGTSLTRNPRFVREVEARVPDKDTILVLLCRSGKRSALAAQALTAADYRHVFSVQEGFEGDLDSDGHRGQLNGWRHHQLPWLQD